MSPVCHRGYRLQVSLGIRRHWQSDRMFYSAFEASHHIFLGGGNSNIFYFHPYLGKIPILTNIFQRGWNHQLVFVVCFDGCFLTDSIPCYITIFHQHLRDFLFTFSKYIIANLSISPNLVVSRIVCMFIPWGTDDDPSLDLICEKTANPPLYHKVSGEQREF